MDDVEKKQEILKFTPALRDAGIRWVSVTYSGSGDEGRPIYVWGISTTLHSPVW